MSKSDKLIPAAELAAMWGKSPRTLANWRCLGKGPEYVKIGADIYYTEDAIEKYINSRTVRTTNG